MWMQKQKMWKGKKKKEWCCWESDGCSSDARNWKTRRKKRKIVTDPWSCPFVFVDSFKQKGTGECE